MSTSTSDLKDILGDQFSKIAVEETVNEPESISNITNSVDIYCECNTIILKQNHAKLIKPSESILELEKHLMYLDSDKFSKRIIPGCYWLVDDMYKFEQIGYTKEISSQASSSTNSEKKGTSPSFTIPKGLRYLLCAECNLCPLGWFEPNTKESYLYVWYNVK